MRSIRSRGGRVCGRTRSPPFADAAGRWSVAAMEPRSAGTLQRLAVLQQLGAQLVVGLVLLERRDEGFHGLDGVQVHHRAAQLAHGLNLVLREELLLFARAALRDINGREDPAVRELAVQDEL